MYRARDPRLGRDVAIKVLAAAIAADPRRRGRLEREARVLAAVNHPGIATVFAIEEWASGHALVMELVEGDTLQDTMALRTAAEPGLPTHEALPIARQVAAALEAAHANGIVHRDLKPSNITVRPDGGVKVLDFGLATMVDGADQRPGVAATATHAEGKLGPGSGTPAYMSPEQARALAAVAAVALFAGTRGRDVVPSTGPTQFVILPPEGTAFGTGARDRTPSLAISSDGEHRVFAATDRSGRRQLWIRGIRSIAAQPLAGTDGALEPFWSGGLRRVREVENSGTCAGRVSTRTATGEAAGASPASNHRARAGVSRRVVDAGGGSGAAGIGLSGPSSTAGCISGVAVGHTLGAEEATFGRTRDRHRRKQLTTKQTRQGPRRQVSAHP